VGPRGCPGGELLIRCTGWLDGEARVRYLDSGTSHPGEAEVCFVAVKAYDIADASSLVEESSETAVVLTNGMGLRDEWKGDWDRRVEPGVTTAGFSIEGDTLMSFSGAFDVPAGGEAFRLLSSVLSRGGVREAADVEKIRWAKWLVNSTLNPVAALTGLPNNRIADAGLRPLIENLLKELTECLPERLARDSEAIARKMLQRLLVESGNICSMLQDVLEGRRTEIDYLTGYAVRQAGSRASCSSSLCRAVSALIEALER
jgi:2-dehydropantoate 2-reductase